MEEENGGIIEWLLDQDLTIICYKIFSFLDTNSFTNSRLVNKDWKEFIDHHFFELKKGRKWIQSKVFDNIFDEDYQPTTQRANYTERLFGKNSTFNKKISFDELRLIFIHFIPFNIFSLDC